MPGIEYKSASAVPVNRMIHIELVVGVFSVSSFSEDKGHCHNIRNALMKLPVVIVFVTSDAELSVSAVVASIEMLSTITCPLYSTLESTIPLPPLIANTVT